MSAWDISHHMKPASVSTKEQENLVDYALKGYDVATISLSAGNPEAIKYAKLHNLQLYLNILQWKLDHSPSETVMQYVCLSLTDDYVIDLRRDKIHSNVSLCEKGIDFLLKKSNSVKDIWSKVEYVDNKLPLMIKVKLVDKKRLTQGCLIYMDLLHPSFSSHESLKESEQLKISCNNLYNAVRAVLPPHDCNFVGKSCFLTQELLEYISGRKKLTIYAFLQDCIEDESCLNNTISCLDFITRLKGITVVMIKNKILLTKETFENINADNEKNLINDLQVKNNMLENYIDKVQTNNNNLKDQLARQETVIGRLSNEINQLHEQIQYQGVEEKKNKDLEIKRLYSENDKLRIALFKKKQLIREIQNAIEAVKKTKSSERFQGIDPLNHRLQ
ncbi:uncharacterized protein EV154DRAFT_478897 [Mucor mucedo]|uniref:uncharacterized protein n=1 Tax=Mucor mucedo TaxID=29922 RepID=UPI0022212B01|nr:uncharacterized protein EV154DRAFT_478897 [Mucor mucedo]KAI7893845.1 hypothetical protein EV154DRAFT_478897 [Mucor mucedo]